MGVDTTDAKECSSTQEDVPFTTQRKTMRTICSGKEAKAAEITKAINDGINTGINKFKARQRAQLYLVGRHLYRLVVDGIPTEKKKVMVGADAKLHNKAMEQMFIEKVRKGKSKAKTKRWVLEHLFHEPSKAVDELKSTFSEQDYQRQRLASQAKLNRLRKTEKRLKELEERFGG